MFDKRKVIWALLALAIAVLTIRTVFVNCRELSPAEVFAALQRADPFWLAVTILSMVGFIVFEAFALLSILRVLGYPRPFFAGVLYSAGDQFFSAITPSASGGQPASILFMRQHKVPGAAITVVLLLNLVMYTAAALFIGALCLILRPQVFLRFDWFSRFLIVFGMVVLTGLGLFFLALLKRGETLERMGRGLFRLLHRLHLMRAPERWNKRLGDMVEEYRLCSQAASGKTSLLIRVFLLDLAQRAAQITVTLTLFLALGGSFGREAADLWVVQAMAQIGSNCVPIPGGMGAADYLMLDGFQSLFAPEFSYQLQILSRGFSFYVCTLLSGIIVLAGALVYRRGARKDKER